MRVSSNLYVTKKEIRSLGGSVSQLQDDLTLPNPEYQNFMRFGKGRFYKKIDPHICYLRKAGMEYVVPRYYFGEPEKGEQILGRKTSWGFKFKLRDYQTEFFEEYAEEVINNSGILMEAPCGHGKTIMAIYLSFLRKRQSLVLVPTYYLANQWKSRIEESTDATVKVVTVKDKEIPTDSDFTVIVMDLFSVRTLPEELYRNVGHVILDEAHRVGAEVYLPILDEIPAYYRTALTATFRRSDGVHRVLAYHFGKHLKMENRFPKPLVYGVDTGVEVRAVISKNRPYEDTVSFFDRNGVKYHETGNAVAFWPPANIVLALEKELKDGTVKKTAYREIKSALKRGMELQYSVVESYLGGHSGRTKRMEKLIRMSLDKGRTVLFLSKRKDVLRMFHKKFSEYRPVLIVAETNSRTEEEEKYLQTECRLILGISQLAKEGMDIDRLDTLILFLPIKDTEQAIGRISRLHPDKKPPVVLYPVDSCPFTYSVFNGAKKFMKINAEFKGVRNLLTVKTVL